MSPENPLAAAAVDLTIVAGVLYLADFVLDPVPLPAVLAAATGLLALWILGGSRSALAMLALLGGGLAGAAHHFHRHSTGASPPPAEGIPFHVLLDALAGLFAALPALTAALAVRGLRRGAPRRRPDPDDATAPPDVP